MPVRPDFRQIDKPEICRLGVGVLIDHSGVASRAHPCHAPTGREHGSLQILILGAPHLNIAKYLTILIQRIEQRLAERLHAFLQPGYGKISKFFIMIALMALALLARIAMAPLEAGIQYVTFFPAVALTAIIGGFRLGMLATFVGMSMATFILTPPFYTVSIEVLQKNMWANTIFFVDGLVVCLAIEAMHRYRLKYEAELIESKKNEARVASINKELDDFAYIAAHDLKEPLRGIHNYASFLKEDYADKLDESGRQYIDSIQRLAERLSTLIDRLLAYSRLGSTELVKDAVDVDEVLDAVEEDLSRLWAEGVELRRTGRLGTVYGDATRIGEVFQNLISNAVKYNDKPSRWVEVGCDKDGAQPVFYVRDNGIGIQPHHQDSVFRIFKRLHEQNKYGGGTGAGLTIVKKIVERHGGRIWLKSVPGEGTVFYFTLSGEA